MHGIFGNSPTFSIYLNVKFSVLYFIRLPQTITISSDEYSRLLQNEVKLIKFTELCQTKASEIKRLQDQLAYFKRQAMRKNSCGDTGDPQVPPKSDVWDRSG